MEKMYFKIKEKNPSTTILCGTHDFHLFLNSGCLKLLGDLECQRHVSRDGLVGREQVVQSKVHSECNLFMYLRNLSRGYYHNVRGKQLHACK